MLKLKKFLQDETGATAIEYGLIAAGIAVAIISVVNLLGANLNIVFTTINTKLTGGITIHTWPRWMKAAGNGGFHSFYAELSRSAVGLY